MPGPPAAGLLRCAGPLWSCIPARASSSRRSLSGSPELPGCECGTPQRSSRHGKSISFQGGHPRSWRPQIKSSGEKRGVSDDVGSAADFSCHCGTAVTWRFLPPSGIIQSSTRCLQLNTLAGPGMCPADTHIKATAACLAPRQQLPLDSLCKPGGR